MSMELASIAANLSKIAAKAARDQQPFVEELAREMHRLCAVVQRIEQASKVQDERKDDKSGCA